MIERMSERLRALAGRGWVLGLTACLLPAAAAAPETHSHYQLAQRPQIEAEEPYVPPPPPPPDQPATYDYSHAVRTDGPLAPVRKYRVALTRMWDNVVLDTEFGRVTGGERSTKGRGKDTPVVEPERYATRPSSMSPAFRALVIDRLVASGFFEVIERDDILPILRELEFGESAYVDPKGHVAKGQLLGVEYLINGEVDLTPAFRQGGLLGTMYAPHRADAPDPGPPRPRYQLILRMYGVSSGVVVASAVGQGATHEEALVQCVDELTRALPVATPDLRLAHVAGNVVYIDGGANRRIAVGRRFRVTAAGREVSNADGEIIGRETHDIGLIEVVEVQEFMSVARVLDTREPLAVGATVVPE